MSARIRVLVADDSPTARALLTSVLAADARLEVVGAARDGFEAVSMARALRPDVAVLDIHMPGLDGVGATRQIMADAPLPVVVVSAAVDVRDLAIAFESERAGAVAARPKPVGPSSDAFERDAAGLVSTVKLMAGLKVVRRRGGERAGAAHVGRAARARVVAIVGSTGGPAALAQIASKLGADFSAPILCVQHITRGWVDALARWLDAASGLTVKVAENGEALRAGTLYLAPDDRHLGVAVDRVALSNAPAVDGFRPSGTPLLESVARAFGRDALGVMLTGMGEDGVDGMRALHDAGGFCVAQDRESSVVWGMPGAVVAAGASHEVLPLEGIIQLLQGMMRDAEATTP